MTEHVAQANQVALGEARASEFPTPQASDTPAAHWRREGKPDPHGDRYECTRAGLTLGAMTDDELANAAFLHYDRSPRMQDVIDGKAYMPIVYMTAVKDRIRWLSRALSNLQELHGQNSAMVSAGNTAPEQCAVLDLIVRDIAELDYSSDIEPGLMEVREADLRAILAHHIPQPAATAGAAHDVLAERRRQVESEHWTPAHDDAHVNDEIAAFAALYAMPPAARDWPAQDTGYGETFGAALCPVDWQPKFGDRRRELVKAGALVLAEIERLDRAALAAPQGGA